MEATLNNNHTLLILFPASALSHASACYDFPLPFLLLNTLRTLHDSSSLMTRVLTHDLYLFLDHTRLSLMDDSCADICFPFT